MDIKSNDDVKTADVIRNVNGTKHDSHYTIDGVNGQDIVTVEEREVIHLEPNPPSLESPLTFSNDRCECCPYGYHIDVDFIRYCNALESGTYLKKLKKIRRTKKKMRKSMEIYLQQKSGESVTAQMKDLTRQLSNNDHRYRSHDHSGSNRILDEIDSSVNNTIQSIDHMIMNPMMTSSTPTSTRRVLTLDTRENNQSKFNTIPWNYKQRQGETVMAQLSDSNRTDSVSSLSSDSTISSEKSSPYVQTPNSSMDLVSPVDRKHLHTVNIFAQTRPKSPVHEFVTAQSRPKPQVDYNTLPRRSTPKTAQQTIPPSNTAQQNVHAIERKQPILSPYKTEHTPSYPDNSAQQQTIPPSNTAQQTVQPVDRIQQTPFNSEHSLSYPYNSQQQIIPPTNTTQQTVHPVGRRQLILSPFNSEHAPFYPDNSQQQSIPPSNTAQQTIPSTQQTVQPVGRRQLILPPFNSEHAPYPNNSQQQTISPIDQQNIDTNSLNYANESMSVTLKRLKELEDQVKAIPVFQARISVLKEEKRLLQLHMKAKNDKLYTRSIGVGYDTIDNDAIESPDNSFYVSSPSPSPSSTPSQSTLADRFDFMRRSGKTKPPVKLPSKTIGVGNHVIYEPYILQPNIGELTWIEQQIQQPHRDGFMASSSPRVIGSPIQDEISLKTASFAFAQSLGHISPRNHDSLSGSNEGIDPNIHIHEKELKTLILNQTPSVVQKRNVGVECKVSTRDVGVSYIFDEVKPFKRSIGVGDGNIFAPNPVQIKESDFKNALHEVLSKNVRSVGVDCKIEKPVRSIGTMHTFSDSRSIGVGDDTIDSKINSPSNLCKSIGVTIKPDVRNASSLTDRGWRVDTGCNTNRLIMESKYTSTDSIRKSNLATMTDPRDCRNGVTQTLKVYVYTEPRDNIVIPQSAPRVEKVPSDVSRSISSQKTNMGDYKTDKSDHIMLDNNNKSFLTNRKPAISPISGVLLEQMVTSQVSPRTSIRRQADADVDSMMSAIETASKSCSLQSSSPPTVVRSETRKIYEPYTKREPIQNRYVSKNFPDKAPSLPIKTSPTFNSHNNNYYQAKTVNFRLNSPTDVVKPSTPSPILKTRKISQIKTVNFNDITDNKVNASSNDKRIDSETETSPGYIVIDCTNEPSNHYTVPNYLESSQVVSTEANHMNNQKPVSPILNLKRAITSETQNKPQTDSSSDSESPDSKKEDDSAYSDRVDSDFDEDELLTTTEEFFVTGNKIIALSEMSTEQYAAFTSGQSQNFHIVGDVNSLVDSGDMNEEKRDIVTKTVKTTKTAQIHPDIDSIDQNAKQMSMSTNSPHDQQIYSLEKPKEQMSGSTSPYKLVSDSKLELEDWSDLKYRDSESDMMTKTVQQTQNSYDSSLSNTADISSLSKMGHGSPSSKIRDVPSRSNTADISSLSKTGDMSPSKTRDVSSRSNTADISSLSKTGDMSPSKTRDLSSQLRTTNTTPHSIMRDTSSKSEIDSYSQSKGRGLYSPTKSSDKSDIDLYPPEINTHSETVIYTSHGSPSPNRKSMSSTSSDSNRKSTSTTSTDSNEFTFETTTYETFTGLSRFDTESSGHSDITDLSPESVTFSPKYSTSKNEDLSSPSIDRTETIIEETIIYETEIRSVFTDSGMVVSSCSETNTSAEDGTSMGLKPLKSCLKRTASGDSQVKKEITFSQTISHKQSTSDSDNEDVASDVEYVHDEEHTQDVMIVDDSDSDASVSSFEEGSYDGRQGNIVYTCVDDQAIAQGTPGAAMYDHNIRETYELSVDMKQSCQLLADYLIDSTTVQSKQLNTCLRVIQQEWFKVAGNKLSDVYMVEDYLSSFNEISRRLIQYIVNIADGNGNTVLHYAVTNAHLDLITLLLDTDIADLNKQNTAGYSPIMLASISTSQSDRHLHIVKRLFHLGDVNAVSSQACQTALMLAVSHGRAETTHCLLETGAHVNAQDEDGSTALMCACEHGYTEIVNILLAHPECDANITDNDGSTALSIAMEAGHRDVGVLLYAHLNFSKQLSPGVYKKTRFSPRSSPTLSLMKK